MHERIGSVNVYQEFHEVRITIVTIHSSTKLGVDDADRLAKAIAKMVRRIKRGKME